MFKFTLPFLFISCFSFSQVPIASFSALPTTACIGAPTVFTNTSNGGTAPLSYLWNFGDSTFSTLTSPTHTFISAGTFNVTLLVTSANGLTASASRQIIIQPIPTPTFVAPISSNCAPASININNTTPSVAGSSYLWNFGNGSTSILENPPAQTYNTNGSFTVSLTITTSAGCSGTTSIPNFITISNVAPSFSADFEGGCFPLTVQFTDQSIPPSPLNPITSWSWNFGNGQTFNGQNPLAQLYSALGFYTVSLSVTTQSGCVGSTVLDSFITVGQINSMNFTVDSPFNCINTDVEFTPTVVVSPVNPSSPITYFWDFNDGSLDTSTVQNPTYQFESDSGYFDVMLVVDYLGCKDTLVMNDMVYINAPTAFFDLDTNLICNPTPLVSAIWPAVAIVSDTSVHGLLSDNVQMIWQWGDGSPNTVLNDAELDDANLGSTTHSYTNYGTYEIQQVINNITTGCSDTSKQFFYVSRITSDFSIPNDTICQGVEIQLSDSSSSWSSHSIDSWTYNMGNQEFVNNGPNPTYTYPGFGNYVIALVVTNDVGCSSSSTESIKVLAPPFAVISTPAADEGGCSPHLVTFLNLTVQPCSFNPMNHFDWTFSDGSPGITTLPVPDLGEPSAPIILLSPGSGYSTANNIATTGGSGTGLTVNITTTGGAVGSNITINNPGSGYNINDIITIVGGTTPSTFRITCIVQPPQTSIQHTFTGEGVYVTTLTAYNDFGCSSFSTKEVTLTKPIAFFTLDNIFCNGTILNTDNLSVGVAPLNYEWYIDNTIGDTLSTDFNPNEPYIEQNVAPGQTSAIHNLILIAEDINGCKDTVSISFTTSIPNANFTENLPNSIPCPPITGDYIDQSTSYGTINTWQWDFGNGNQSGLQNPSNTYFFPGTYDLSLTITDQYGCQDDTLFNDYIIVGGPSGIPQYNYDVCTQTASFFITDQNNISSVVWNLGNGTTQSNLSFDYVYNIGTYSPSVILTDAAGCNVPYPINPQIIVTNTSGLSANFSANPNPVDINTAVTVLDQSSSSLGSPITSWSWDFGNGTTSNLQNPPSTTYPLVSPYTISLTIGNTLGCSSTYTLIINVNSDIVPILPNVFTPNGDGNNDNFVLLVDSFSSYTFTVMNRWGNIVFEKDRDPSSPLFLWDAKTNGGEKCKDGVYFYRLKGLLNGGTEFDKTGYITLVNQ
jgi:gliding motility-associated-like protein